MARQITVWVSCVYFTLSIASIAIADKTSSSDSGSRALGPFILYSSPVQGKPFESKKYSSSKNGTKENQSEITEKLPFAETSPAPEVLQDLKEISFKTLSPVPLYQKTYFTWVVLAGTFIIGAAFSYFTAGAGAPAAATGVSTVASWIAGGGAGSYMAGLATVGSCIGGNAMAGAAILNGLSIALGGTLAKGLTSAILSTAIFTATILDGIATLSNTEAGRLHYTVRLNPPVNIGSKSVQKLVGDIQKLREKQAEILLKNSIKDAQQEKEQALQSIAKDFTNLMIEARDKLNIGLESNNLTTSDLLVLGIINYGSGEENSLPLFQRAIARIAASESNLKKSGYLSYLMAISCLCDGNENSAMYFLYNSITQECYAIEPAVLKLNLHSAKFPEEEPKARITLKTLEQNFSPNNYKTDLSLVAPYFRMATICYSKDMFKESEEFYSKALGKIGLFEEMTGDASLRSEIRLGIANSLFKMGETRKANQMYTEITKKFTDQEEKKFRERYEGMRNAADR